MTVSSSVVALLQFKDRQTQKHVKELQTTSVVVVPPPVGVSRNTFGLDDKQTDSQAEIIPASGCHG